MPGMTYGDLQNELASLFDSKQSARIQLWIKQAIHDVVTASLWSWREAESAELALTASQKTLMLQGASPVVPDFGGLISAELVLVAAGKRQELLECDLDLFRQLANRSTKNGIPALCTVAGGAPAADAASVRARGVRNLLVWPAATAVSGEGEKIVLRYWMLDEQREPTANAHVPLVPISDHDAIVFRAIELGFAANRQFPNAQDYAARYKEKLGAMLVADLPMRHARGQREVVGMTQRDQPIAPPAGK